MGCPGRDVVAGRLVVDCVRRRRVNVIVRRKGVREEGIYMFFIFELSAEFSTLDAWDVGGGRGREVQECAFLQPAALYTPFLKHPCLLACFLPPYLPFSPVPSTKY